MNKHRRKYKFADNQYHDVDMTQYSKIIIDTINKTVPNKHHKVFKDHFSTDPFNNEYTVMFIMTSNELHDELKKFE